MGRVAEWLKATDCKSVEVFYVGFPMKAKGTTKKRLAQTYHEVFSLFKESFILSPSTMF
jgi:hypothetical protein